MLVTYGRGLMLRDRILWVMAAVWLAAEGAGVVFAVVTHDPACWTAVLVAAAITAALAACTRALRLCLADWFGGYAARAAQEEAAGRARGNGSGSGGRLTRLR